MRKLDPNDIPEILSLVAKIYTEQRQPTAQENSSINTFFTMYMGKAMEDCQQTSMSLWSPSKPKSEICFASKIVEIDPKDESGGKVEFIVASTRGVKFNAVDVQSFQKKTQEKVVEEFASKEDWVMVYNRMMFGQDKNQPTSHFINGLFIGIRFSKDYFMDSDAS